MTTTDPGRPADAKGEVSEALDRALALAKEATERSRLANDELKTASMTLDHAIATAKQSNRRLLLSTIILSVSAVIAVAVLIATTIKALT